MYAIVDIETTGGYASRNKITEIAIFIHDGTQIVDSYETLINPERNIPSHITALTGITNDMVATAPKFYEVAKKILEFTEGMVFVAHNVNFDYSFIKSEYESLGGSFHRKKLCTVRLSRKIIPGLPSYSLGNLCQQVNIPLNDRHRAAGDAEATAKLFGLLVSTDEDGHIEKALKGNSRETILPPNLAKEDFTQLPHLAGVYYFHDVKGQVIYVGKAIDIKKRITGHFSGSAKEWSKQHIRNEIHNISYELTGNELVALLLESHEIKRLWPRYNRAQKNTGTNWGIFSYEDRKGYLRVGINRMNPVQQPLLTFKSHEEARKFLSEKVKEYGLCPKYCGLQKAPKACFDYQIGACQGACVEKVSTEDYNRQVEKAIASFASDKHSFVIFGKGRNAEETTLVLVEQGAYQGFGYMDKNTSIGDFETAKSHVKHYKDNQEVQRIIYGHLKKVAADQVHFFDAEGVRQG